MARRVRFDGSGLSGSPLRISVAGADAATAEFNDCIFDGNQPPLRLWGTGFVAVAGITWNQRQNGQNIREGGAFPVAATPDGTTPVFITMWRRDDGLGRLFTPSFSNTNNPVVGGAGGGICSNSFVPACFTVGAPAFPDNLPNQTFINYCIFKNAG